MFIRDMSRFKIATLAFAAVVGATGILAPDPLRWWLLGGLAGMYLALLGLGADRFSGWEFFGPAICRGRPGGMSVSLTFDDGPDPASTPRLLEILEQHQVKAAFFLIGRKAEKHRTVGAGHRQRASGGESSPTAMPGGPIFYGGID